MSQLNRSRKTSGDDEAKIMNTPANLSGKWSISSARTRMGSRCNGCGRRGSFWLLALLERHRVLE